MLRSASGWIPIKGSNVSPLRELQSQALSVAQSILPDLISQCPSPALAAEFR